MGLAELRTCPFAREPAPATHERAHLHALHPVASLLSYLTKAPLVPDGAPVVNALAAQRAALENVLRAAAGLPPENHMLLEFR